jgi:ATP-dependent protease HslVU (ClpYQ) ATPase subunit
MMKAIKYEKESVLIQDGKIKAWVDIWVENEDVICDWNQNDFVMTDSKDVSLKNWQDNLKHFEDATNLAIETLEKQGIIYQDEIGKWHQIEKYHTIKGSIPIK